jgi:hypothetical protein
MLKNNKSKVNLRSDMVTHTCNSSHPRGRDHKDQISSQPEEKVSKTPISTNNQEWWSTSVESQLTGGIGRRIVAQGQPRPKHKTPYEK